MGFNIHVSGNLDDHQSGYADAADAAVAEFEYQFSMWPVHSTEQL